MVKSLRVRVRAILLTRTGDVLLFRRKRPETPVYWSLPGGGVEPTDPSLEDALHREVHEELNGTIIIDRLVAILDDVNGRGVQYIYVARISSWSEEDRTGPEFSDPAKGSYDVELVR